MTAKRMFTEDLIFNMVHYALLYAIFAISSVLLTGIDEAALWMLFSAIPFFINFLLRRYVRITFIMVLAHLIIPAAVFFLFEAEILYRAYVMAVLFIITIYSFVQRTKGRYNIEPAVGIISSLFIVAVCFFALHLDHAYAHIIYPVLVVVVILGYEIHSRMTKVDVSLEVISQVSEQPVKKILKFDHKMMLAMVLILIVFTLVTRYFLTDPFLEQVSRIEFAEQPDGTPPAPTPPLGGVGLPPINPALFGFDEAPEPHPIWDIIDMILFILIQVTIVLLFITLFISGIIAFYKLMGYKKIEIPYDDGRDEKATFIPERVKRKRRKILPSVFPWQEDRIRRLFRKKIIRHKKAGVEIMQSDTPEKMAERISDKENIEALTAEYEKKRYNI